MNDAELSPVISVITVCKNPGSLLIPTIRSVESQTYCSIEYIIIDGSSSDGTIELCQQWEHIINVFISENDNGLYDAMNKGIKLAKGDLILFLNAGDYFLSKDVLEFAVSKMNFRNADLFFGRIIWNDPRTKDITVSDHSFSSFNWDLLRSNFPHPATFYKKSLFDKIGNFELSYSVAADYEWNVRALILNEVWFQYINIIISLFFADGVSNNPLFAAKHEAEIERINKLYFKPYFIYNFFKSREKFPFRKSIEKLIAKIFKARLHRRY